MAKKRKTENPRIRVQRACGNNREEANRNRANLQNRDPIGQFQGGWKDNYKPVEIVIKEPDCKAGLCSGESTGSGGEPTGGNPKRSAGNQGSGGKAPSNENRGVEALRQFEALYTKERPKVTDSLARILVEAYINNTDQDGSAKATDSGIKIYGCGAEFVAKLYGLTPTEIWGKLRTQRIAREDLGLNRDMLEEIVQKGINVLTFTDIVAKSATAHLGEVLDGLCQDTLTKVDMTPEAKKYLVERATKLEIQALQEYNSSDKISSLDEFRYVASIIAKYKREH